MTLNSSVRQTQWAAVLEGPQFVFVLEIVSEIAGLFVGPGRTSLKRKSSNVTLIIPMDGVID